MDVRLRSGARVGRIARAGCSPPQGPRSEALQDQRPVGYVGIDDCRSNPGGFANPNTAGCLVKTLPPSVACYRQTPEFTEGTIPAGLTKAHRTKSGVWGRIVVSRGRLLYRVLGSRAGEFTLAAGNPGIVEPGVEHEVEPLGKVRFHVEFYR